MLFNDSDLLKLLHFYICPTLTTEGNHLSLTYYLANFLEYNFYIILSIARLDGEQINICLFVPEYFKS